MVELSVDKDLLGPWICRRIGKVWSRDGKETVGIVDGGRVLGVVLFEDNTGVAMTCHVAIAHAHVPIRRLIVAAAHYAFIDNGVEKLMGAVNSKNLKALRFDLKLGFEAYAVLPRMYGDGGDCVILIMTRESCRWIPERFRKAA
jgi:L-amino acid N-acyltransferase YncA